MRKKNNWVIAIVMCLLMNLPLNIHGAEAEDNFRTALTAGEVDQNKQAKWIDYANGIAEITFDVVGKDAEEPIDVVMLMDNSTSMLAGSYSPGSNTAYEMSGRAAKQFINSALERNKDSRIAIVPFSDYLFDENRKKTIWDYYAVPVDENGRTMTHHILFLSNLKMDKNNQILENKENKETLEYSNQYGGYEGLPAVSFDDLKPLAKPKGNLVTPLTNDDAYLTEILDQLIPRGNTNYEKPISKASSILMNEKDNGRKKYIIMLSDGQPNSGSSQGTYLDGINAMNKLKNQLGSQLTVFSIGLNLSSTENALASEKLSALASVGADGQPLYFNIKSANLDEVYKKISGETKTAATEAVITDYINTEYFSYYSDDTYKPTVNGVEAASATFNESEGKVTWNIGDITEDVKTLKFYVKIKNTDGSTSADGLLNDITNGNSLLNQAGQYETNTEAYLTYTDAQGNAVTSGHEMASPSLPIKVGAIHTTLYASDINGNYLDENGAITDKEHAAILKTSLSEQLVDGYEYEISPQQEITIQGITYIVYAEDAAVVSITVEADSTKEVSFRYAVKPEHIVTFDANGGTISSDFFTQTVVYPNQHVTALADVTAPEGMDFVNWFDESGNVFDLQTVVDHDQTVYAHYEWKKFIVTFQDEYGTIYKTEEVTYGGNAHAPQVSKDGMYFAGWDIAYTNVKQNLFVTAIFRTEEQPPITPEPIDPVDPPVTPNVPPLPGPPADTENITTVTPIPQQIARTPILETTPNDATQTVIGNDTDVTEEIQNNETPKTEEIQTEETPLASGKSNGNAWALVNLLAMLGSIVCGIILILSRHKKEEEEDEDEEQDAVEQETISKRRRWTKAMAIVIAVVSVIFFILTEDIRLPMIFVDRYTLYMLILLTAQVIILMIGRKWKEQEEEEAEPAAQE